MKNRARLTLLAAAAAAVLLGSAGSAAAAETGDPADLPCDSGGSFEGDSGLPAYWWNNCDDSRGQEISFTGVGTSWTVCAPTGVNELVPYAYFYSAHWTGEYC